jgi:hypothetical protein
LPTLAGRGFVLFLIWTILRQLWLWLPKPPTLLVLVAAFELNNLLNVIWNSLNLSLYLLLR